MIAVGERCRCHVLTGRMHQETARVVANSVTRCLLSCQNLQKGILSLFNVCSRSSLMEDEFTLFGAFRAIFASDIIMTIKCLVLQLL